MAEIDHSAYGFMSENAGSRCGASTIERVKVGAADRGEGNLDQQLSFCEAGFFQCPKLKRQPWPVVYGEAHPIHYIILGVRQIG